MTGYPSFRVLSAEDRAYIAGKIAAGEADTITRLATETARDRNAVAAFCKQVVAGLTSRGKTPECACGKPLFHLITCAKRGPKAITGPLRGRVLAMLLDGAVFHAVAAACGLTYNQVHQISRSLSVDQKAARRGAFGGANRRRGKPRGKATPAASGIRDALYQRIRATVPKGVPPALRDDIISEVYLAVLEQRIPVDAIEREAKRFVNAGYAAWSSRYSPRSLDERISDDDARCRAKMIPDPAAPAAFDRIGFAREWA